MGTCVIVISGYLEVIKTYVNINKNQELVEMFNSTFFFGMVCTDPTWVTKDGKDELQFLVSTIDREKEKFRDRVQNSRIEYVKIPVIVSNPNFGDSLMKNKGLSQGSKIVVEGSITAVPGSFGAPSIAVSARTIRVEMSDAPQRNDFHDDFEEQPPINPARKPALTGRLRNE